MGHSQGKFIWYELATTDTGAAKRFYGDVVGWGTEEYGGAGMTYVRWTAAGQAIGGLVPLSDEARKRGAPPHWVAYVMVDDVDATVALAKSLGGTSCVPAMDIPTVGRIAVIADPDGAVIALITPLGPDAPWRDDVPNLHVSWHELMTNDQEKAIGFYGKLFGWGKTEAVESPMGVYQMYGKHGHTLGGIGARPKDYPVPPHWLYYVKVPDLDAALARVAKSGGQVLHGPMTVPGGSRVAQCRDPQGAGFALHGVGPVPA
jgi:uncharacterized protein